MKAACQIDRETIVNKRAEADDLELRTMRLRREAYEIEMKISRTMTINNALCQDQGCPHFGTNHIHATKLPALFIVHAGYYYNSGATINGENRCG